MSPSGARRREPRKPGSQTALRRQNTLRVLEALAQGGPSTQAKLARSTGLSTGTVSNIVKDLSGQSRITLRPVIDSGRRAIEIALNDSRVSIGLDINATCMRLVVARLDHTIVAEMFVDLPAGHEPVTTLRSARLLIDSTLTLHGLEFHDVMGLGVALPTILDERFRPLLDDHQFPGWYGHDLAAIAETTFPFPVRFENDANVQALAHITWGPWSRSSVLVAVKVGTGIGAGIVVDGRVIRGAVGGAGELGHLPVVNPGKPCPCGNRGCLQTVSSVETVLAEVRKVRHLRTLQVADVIDLARRRDPATMRILEEAGMALGTALAGLVTLLNPHAVVISGPLAPVGPSLLDPIMRSMNRTAHPALGPGTVVSMSQLGDRAEAVGAAALAALNITSPT